MEYTVTSSKKVCGKINGEKLTESDIISAGGNIEFLIASGHIKEASKTPKIKETIEEPQVQEEEPKAFVFNNLNYEGDK